MKQVRRVGYATALLCITSVLIAAFIVFFSNAGCSSNEKPKENKPGKTSVASKPAGELKTHMR